MSQSIGEYTGNTPTVTTTGCFPEDRAVELCGGRTSVGVGVNGVASQKLRPHLSAHGEKPEETRSPRRYYKRFSQSLYVEKSY